MDIDRYTLHRARVTAGLSLEELATRTRISPGLLKLIDDGRFVRLPGGIYARSYVRAVAKVLSIDADEAVKALAPLMRDAQWGEAASPVPAAASHPENARAREASGTPAAMQAVWQGRDDDWRRWGAAAVDGCILGGMWLGLLLLVMIAAGGGEALGVPGFAGVSIAAALLAMIYFFVFAGLGGATPGDQVVKLAPLDEHRPLDGSIIRRRAVLSFLVKASIIVDVVCTTEWALDAFGIKSVE